MDYSAKVDLLLVSTANRKERAQHAGCDVRVLYPSLLGAADARAVSCATTALTSRTAGGVSAGLRRLAAASPTTSAAAAGKKMRMSRKMAPTCTAGHVRSGATATEISSDTSNHSSSTETSPLHVRCEVADDMTSSEDVQSFSSALLPAGNRKASGTCAVSNSGKMQRGRRPVNPIPRHKRDAHISAEYRRRHKIQRGFDTVRTLVPLLRGAGCAAKDSKASMLKKCADFIRELTEDCMRQEQETKTLGQEVDSLRKELELYQQQLPASGVSTLEKPSWQAQRMLEEYLRKAVLQDWRHWIFSHVVRPLFASYNQHVTMSTLEAFTSSVTEWSDSHLNLVSLRPIILSTLRGISTSTAIMSNPENLECEILDMVKEVKPVLPELR